MPSDTPPATGGTDVERLLAALAVRGWWIATAESLTGGLLVAALVDAPGASAHVRGGVVAYATDLKHSILGVDAALLDAHGPVHPEVAAQMAEGACRVTGRGNVPAEVGVSTTGIAGPDSPDGQPVGTVHIGVATPAGTTVASLRLHGTRTEIRRETVVRALVLALEAL